MICASFIDLFVVMPPPPQPANDTRTARADATKRHKTGQVVIPRNDVIPA
jgi:hypothetical protein